MSDILQSMAAAVAAAPGSAALRVQYARLLLSAGYPAQALEHASAALTAAPTDADALALVTQAAQQIATVGAAGAGDSSTGAETPPVAPAVTQSSTTPAPGPSPQATAPIDAHHSPVSTESSGSAPTNPTAAGSGVNWADLESEVSVDIPPPFTSSTPLPAEEHDVGGEGLLLESAQAITLADVGGLEPVKHRLREAFLEPMRNPEIARAFGQTMRGGLLLYGPPGTGKTFVARAVAGELGARFLTLTLADILDKWFGNSEKALHDAFQNARRKAPAVLFLDELDAIGGKRATYASSGMRGVVNQLLQELDGIGSQNDGLFVLGATNNPWDVDTALLRPGRFDRVVLVLPPDAPAREAILRHHLSKRPIAGIDLGELVARTEDFSGADLAHVCSTAAEKAMAASIATGQVQPIGMGELRAALAEIRPSTTTWLQSARNVVTYANNDGRYDDLAAYLRARKML